MLVAIGSLMCIVSVVLFFMSPTMKSPALGGMSIALFVVGLIVFVIGRIKLDVNQSRRGRG